MRSVVGHAVTSWLDLKMRKALLASLGTTVSALLVVGVIVGSAVISVVLVVQVGWVQIGCVTRLPLRRRFWAENVLYRSLS